MMNLAFSTALSALLATSAFQEPALESAIFDLGALAVQTDQAPEGLSVMDPFGWVHGGGVGVESDGLHPGRLVDLFSQVLELDGRESMRSVGGSDDAFLLSLVASPQRVEIARELYRFLEASLNQSRRFEVFAFDASKVSATVNASGSVLSAEEATQRIEAVRSSGAEVQRWALAIKPGRTGLISNENTIPFLADYDVEIAQGAFIFNPVNCYPQLGQVIAARATPAGDATRLSLFVRATEAIGLPRSRSVTFGGLAVSDRAQVQSLDSVMPLEQLDVQTHGFGIQVALHSGEAVELSMERSAGGAERVSYLVRCLDQGAGAVHRKAFGERELVLIDPGAGNRGSIRFEAEDRLFSPTPHESETIGYAVLPVEEWGPVIDRLRLGGNAGASGQLGPFVTYLVDGAARSSTGFETYLRELESADAEHSVVTATVETPDDPLARFRLPCLKGSRGFAFSARGNLQIVEADVEVAQNVSVIEPIVAQVMEGAMFAWRAQEGGEVRIEAAVRSGERTTVSLGELGKGVLDRMPLRFLNDRRGLVDGVAEMGSQGGSGIGAVVQLQ